MKLFQVLVLSIVIASSQGCNKTSVKCDPKVNANCICTLEYAPVCGCDDKTYGNACSAECANISEYTEGECS